MECIVEMDVEKTVRENIDKTIHLSLATVSGDAPWVCEVHFAYDESLNLYFRSLASRRHSQEIAANPKVAGNIVDKFGLGDSVVGVYFEGEAKKLESKEELEIANECIKERLKMDGDLLSDAADPEGHQFYKITVKNWYVFGRFGGPSGQKYTLEWNGGAQ